MSFKLIIGYGNPLRSDDGVGWHVAEELTERLPNSEFEVVQSHQLMPELAEKISRSELVIFVDATRGERPGEWTCKEVHKQAPVRAFSHAASPEGLLALAQGVYGAAPPAFLFVMCGGTFEHGDRLSPTVAERLPSFVAAIRSLAFAGRSQNQELAAR
jgi:hydrogenase maturation protease